MYHFKACFISCVPIGPCLISSLLPLEFSTPHLPRLLCFSSPFIFFPFTHRSTSLLLHLIFLSFSTHYSISIIIYIGGVNVLSHSMVSLRDVWENTSFALEGRQCDTACVAQERSGLLTRNGPTYKVGCGGISWM